MKQRVIAGIRLQAEHDRHAGWHVEATDVDGHKESGFADTTMQAAARDAVHGLQRRRHRLGKAVQAKPKQLALDDAIAARQAVPRPGLQPTPLEPLTRGPWKPFEAHPLIAILDNGRGYDEGDTLFVRVTPAQLERMVYLLENHRHADGDLPRPSLLGVIHSVEWSRGPVRPSDTDPTLGVDEFYVVQTLANGLVSRYRDAEEWSQLEVDHG